MSDYPPLLRAISSGDHVSLRTAIANGADVNSDYRGQTPVIWAARQGDLNAIEILAEAGADLNAVSDSGETVISRSFDQPELITGLLVLGATPRPCDAPIVELTEFPQRAERAEFRALVAALEQATGHPGRMHEFGRGTFTVVLPTPRFWPEDAPLLGDPRVGPYRERRQAAVHELIGEFADRVRDCGCLLLDARITSRQATHLVLLPTSSPFTAMAAMGTHDWPDGPFVSALIAGFAEFHNSHPFDLLGCRQHELELRFRDAAIDPQSAEQELKRIFRGGPWLSPLFGFRWDAPHLHLWWNDD